MGSSGALTVLIACKENLHPRQPGNSKAQNSPCDPLTSPSADGISNRHLNGTVASWAIMHRCPGRSGDGTQSAMSGSRLEQSIALPNGCIVPNSIGLLSWSESCFFGQ